MKQPLDDFHYHEIAHTAHLATDFFAENLESHVAVLGNKELKEEAEKITDLLYKFYNLCSKFADSEDRVKEYNY